MLAKYGSTKESTLQLDYVMFKFFFFLISNFYSCIDFFLILSSLSLAWVMTSSTRPHKSSKQKQTNDKEKEKGTNE